MPKASRSKAGRTRTFTGCRTCRLRRIKCDEARPGCNVCQQLGLDCGGYSPRLLWSTDDDAAAGQESQGNHASRLRYPLFSDVERQSMCKCLLESLGSRVADDILLDLDVASRGVGIRQEFSLFKGPFGAFQVCGDEAAPPVTTTQSPSESPTSDSLSADPEEKGREREAPSSNPDKKGAESEASSDYYQDLEPQEWPQQLSQVDFDTFGGSLDSTLELISQGYLGTDPTLVLPDPALDLFAAAQPDTSVMRSLDPTTDSYDTAEDVPGVQNTDDASSEGHMVLASPNALLRELPTSTSHDATLPEQAALLLRHYKEHIESSATAIGARRQSPWQLVFLPCAFQTFAELSLMGTASHSRVAVLCALLARSAFRIHKSDSDPKTSRYWRALGIRHTEMAQCHLQSVLELEPAGCSDEPYEELLRALLAMAVIPPCHGGHVSQNFLLDAERLIRDRGIPDQKPQSIRILHHLYTYLRVIAESISNFAGFSSLEAQNSSPEAALCSRTFRVSEESLNLGLDPTVEKTAKLGYADIHLEIQGLWRQTLHSTIHGIPESLMTLLAQTVSLANEKANLEFRARYDAKVSNDLKCHIKTLEERIWSWCLNSELTINSGPERVQVLNNQEELIHHPDTQSMVLAMHRAVVIYFYRRVYDVSAMIIQDIVQEAMEYLEPCIEKLVDDDDFTPSLAWAAFIAASEAIRPDLRKRALVCVSITDSRSFYCGSRLSTERLMSIWAGSN